MTEANLSVSQHALSS